MHNWGELERAPVWRVQLSLSVCLFVRTSPLIIRLLLFWYDTVKPDYSGFGHHAEKLSAIQLWVAIKIQETQHEANLRRRRERDQEIRRNETSEQKAAWLAKRREKDRARRAQRRQSGILESSGASQETEHQREQCLAAQRRRTNSGRQRETTPERELRQAGDAARSRLRRERETTPERELHQAGDASRSRSRRRRETTPRDLHQASDAHTLIRRENEHEHLSLNDRLWMTNCWNLVKW